MPYLKSVEQYNKNKEDSNKSYKTKKNWIYKNIYNTSRWKKLRMAYLSDNPLCEECKDKGIIKQAEHIHHKKEISSGKTEEEMKQLAFDSNNLQSLCSDCHKAKHEKKINYFLFDDDDDEQCTDNNKQ